MVAVKSIDLAVRFLTGRSNFLRRHEDHGKPTGEFIIKYSSTPGATSHGGFREDVECSLDIPFYNPAVIQPVWVRTYRQGSSFLLEAQYRSPLREVGIQIPEEELGRLV